MGTAMLGTILSIEMIRREKPLKLLGMLGIFYTMQEELQSEQWDW